MEQSFAVFGSSSFKFDASIVSAIDLIPRTTGTFSRDRVLPFSINPARGRQARRRPLDSRNASPRFGIRHPLVSGFRCPRDSGLGHRDHAARPPERAVRRAGAALSRRAIVLGRNRSRGWPGESTDSRGSVGNGLDLERLYLCAGTFIRGRSSSRQPASSSPHDATTQAHTSYSRTKSGGASRLVLK